MASRGRSIWIPRRRHTLSPTTRCARGFTFVPAHTFNPDITDTLPQLPDSPATYAGKRGAPTLRPQWSKAQARAMGERLSEDLTMDATPEDMLDTLAQHGLEVKGKGKGHVVGNVHGYAKLSSLGLTASAKHLARAVGALPSQLQCFTSSDRHRSTVFDVDAVDIARAFHSIGLLTKEDVRAAIDDARVQRQQRRPQRQSSVFGLSTALTNVAPRPGRPSRQRSSAGKPNKHAKAR